MPSTNHIPPTSDSKELGNTLLNNRPAAGKQNLLGHVPAVSWSVLFLLIIASISLVYIQIRTRQWKAEAKDIQLVSQIETRTMRSLEPVIADLRMVADEPTLLAFLDSPTAANRAALVSRYVWWSSHESSYFEVRFINSDGMESVRVDNRNGHTYGVPSASLQNKAERYFFQKSMGLTEGHAYISPMDLNIDHNTVEIPLRPTLRACMPVFDKKGRKRGVVVLNYDAGAILRDIAATTSESSVDLHLLNSDGYWLRSPNPREEWGFVLPGRYASTFQNRFPMAWRQLTARDSGSFYTSDGQFAFATIHAIRDHAGAGHTSALSLDELPGSSMWRIVSHRSAASIRAESLRMLFPVGALDVFVIIPLVFFSRRYALIQVRHHQMEGEIRQQAHMLDQADDAIYIIDHDSMTVRSWNVGAVRQYGWTKEEALGQNLHTLLHGSFPVSRSDFAHLLLRQGSWQGEVLNQSRHGNSVDTMSRWTLQRGFDGRPTAVVIIDHDIRARKQAEQELRIAYEQNKIFMNAIPSLLIGLDASGAVIWWNPAAEAVFDLAYKEVNGKQLYACGITWLDETPLIQPMSSAPYRIDKLKFSRRGEIRFLALKVVPIALSSDQNNAFLIVGADITERLQLETQLEQARKMEGIGQLAAGIAHEINTPTQYISSNLSFISDAWHALANLITECHTLHRHLTSGSDPSDSLARFDLSYRDVDHEYLVVEVPRALQESGDGLIHISHIVEAMKEFSLPSSQQKQLVDINAAIVRATTLTSSEWRTAAELEQRLAPDLEPVPCIAADFNQVLLNLIVNATYAIREKQSRTASEKGLITITTTMSVSSPGITITVRDTGTGIPEPIRERIFEPFFTTKEVGKGLGQGLSVAHTVIVQRLGGKLWFETNEGEGTEFFIHLPAA